ncbi:MAG: ImmA/IrrE family metallo-endopeptidase [Symbiobacteriaceae bacterium]|nr:ImmA/IrrE family metallo-endopeptidase [Symbiobacteriaceae bacterium]
MATMDYISRIAVDLVRRFRSRDPGDLARALGIMTRYRDLGENLNAYYFCQSRQRVITVNNRLNESAMRVYLAHELGHDQIPAHREVALAIPLRDLEQFDHSSPLEYEANIFAAELLIDDDRLIELLGDDLSFFGAAKELRVPMELLDFKFRLLKRRGLSFEPLYIAQGDFLKRGLVAEHQEEDPYETR